MPFLTTFSLLQFLQFMLFIISTPFVLIYHISTCWSTLSNNVPFTNTLSNDAVVPPYTFMGIVKNALTVAWNTTYKNNPADWDADKWKSIIGNAFNANNSFFCDLSELPLTISKLNGTKNTLGKYMRELQGRNFG